MTNDQIQQKLIAAAQEVRKNSYSPYSNYPVGAALITEDGEIYSGTNIENAAYPSSICAERVAIFKAVSDGKKKFTAMAVVTNNAGSPCGSCRQVMAEFGIDAEIFITDSQGVVQENTRVKALLPYSFGSEKLFEK